MLVTISKLHFILYKTVKINYNKFRNAGNTPLLRKQFLKIN